jgi:hypothetical protein
MFVIQGIPTNNYVTYIAFKGTVKINIHKASDLDGFLG